jgi:glucokinase
MFKNERRPVVAIDLGGTKIIAALVSVNGEIVDRERILTLANEGPETIIERMLGAVDRLLERQGIQVGDLKGICVAAAGPVDMKKGIVSTPPHLPGWYAVPLRDIVRDRYGIDSYLINDARAAVLGEHRFGAGKGVNNLICITLGTGIGGGFITNGQLYLGEVGGAGEVGHMTIDVNGPRCPCGNTGCWELFASGTALEREVSRQLVSGDTSALTDIAKKKGGIVTSVDIAEAARNGDVVAIKAIAWSARYLGVGLVNLVNLFNPGMIVIGGGLSKIGNILLEPAIQVVRDKAFRVLSNAVRIVPSDLGDDAGVLGAAAFTFIKGEI